MVYTITPSANTITSTTASTTITIDAVTVCQLDDLEDNLGAAVLLDDGTQIALFRVTTPTPAESLSAEDATRVYAVSNIDPYSGASVISRGIIGDHEGEATVASPLLKQRFRLKDGQSLEDDAHQLNTYRVELTGDGEGPRQVRVWL